MKTMLARSAALAAGVLIGMAAGAPAQAASESVQGCTLKQIALDPDRVSTGGPVRAVLVSYQCAQQQSGDVEVWHRSPGGREQVVGVVHDAPLQPMGRVRVRPQNFRMLEGCFVAKLRMRGGEARIEACTTCVQMGIGHVRVREH